MWARRFFTSGRALLQASERRVKKTTGLTGLEVVPDAREKLIKLYHRTLLALEVIPEGVVYRRVTEKLTRFRLQVCEEEEHYDKIEERISFGQVEELIIQAEDELKLIPKMAEWKPWVVPKGYTVKIIDDGVERLEHLPTHRSTWDDIRDSIAAEEDKEKAAAAAAAAAPAAS